MANSDTKSLLCPQCGGIMEQKKDDLLSCPYCGYSEIFTSNGSNEANENEKRKRIIAEYELDKQKKRSEKRKWRLIGMIPFLVLLFFIIFSSCRELLEKQQKEAEKQNSENAAATIHKPECDAFDYITVSFSGTDGAGQITINKTTRSDSVIDPDRIEYSTGKKALREGDTVIVSARSSEYSLTEQAKAYTVSGLDLYLSDESQFTEEIRALIMEYSRSYIEKQSDYSSYGVTYSCQWEALYLIFDPDTPRNKIVDVYQIHFSKGDAECDRYIGIVYDGCVLQNDSQIVPFTYQHQKNSGSLLFKIDQVASSGYFWGYASLFDLETDFKNEADQNGYTIFVKIN